jgi:hypothetical protein
MRSQRPVPGTEKELPEQLRSARRPQSPTAANLGAAVAAGLGPAAVQYLQGELGNRNTSLAIQDGQAAGADRALAGTATVQRAPKDKKRTRDERRQRTPEGHASSRAVAAIASDEGKQPTYDEGATTAHRLPKRDSEVACWEWAVRAAATSGGLDRGAYWNYLAGWEETVPGLEQLEPTVLHELQTLLGSLQRAGMRGGAANLGNKKSEASIRPLMQKAVETFVTAHGFQISSGRDPAAWIMCQYRMDGNIGAPEHWWIELPNPQGEPVMVQTVNGVNHYEAGGTNLRWHAAGSAGGRDDGHQGYVTLNVPVKALKGEHTRIIKGFIKDVDRERSRSSGEEQETGSSSRQRSGRQGRR